MGLFAELRRRNVIRVGLLYGVASWVVLQVADVLFGIMALPDWSLRLVFGILLLGLPVALVVAWVFELTPEGLRRERPAGDAPRLVPQTAQRLDLAIVVLLVVAVAGLALDRFVPRVTTTTVAGPGPAQAAPTLQVAPRADDGITADARPGRATAAPDPRSVAVLPFVNMSGDPDNEFFSDGLTEELLNVLAQLDGLRVAARTSAFRFKGQAGDLADIAAQLRVAHVLEGSVRRSGDRVRVTAQLVNAADGFHLWSANYDRQLTDIFAIQDDIAAEVARALRVRLLGDAAPTVPRPPTGNMEAYTAYLRGKQALRIDSYESFERAAAAFREALTLDPGFAAAHAALAETWRRRGFWGVVPSKEAAEEVRLGVARALELEPEQPLAWALDGELKLADEAAEPSFTVRLDAAERSLRRALELEPGQPQASESLAFVLRQRGSDDEALRVLLAALERDPLSARVHGAIGDHHRHLGDLDQAALRFLAAAELAPADPLTASRLMRTRYAQGRIGEAVVLASRQLQLDPRDHEGPLVVVQFYLELGMTDAALPWLEAAERMGPEATTTRLFRALWHWRRGEHHEAAAISAAALEADLPDRWASRLKFGLMVAMHEQAQGGYERSLSMLLDRAPTAMDPLGPAEPTDTEEFFQKINAVPLIRLRDGEVAARARATELLAHLERQDTGTAPQITGAARLTLYGILGRSEDAVAEVRALERGGYPTDEWFWSEADLSVWAEPDAPVVQAYQAETEAIRARERAWLAVPGRMPDPEVVLAAMARAAASTPDREAADGVGPELAPGSR